MGERATIEITNLKSIERLVFPIPKSGTWLLTGENGAGKSAILTCLYRMLYKDAFRDHFPSSAISPRLDSFVSSQVAYQIGAQRVVYRRNTHRWAARPRRRSKLITEIGYSGVVHVGATADRISPKPEDFDPSRSRQAPQELIDLANEIFRTRRFDGLRIVNVTRGVNEAFVIRKGDRSPYNYFSEKLLSVGELCVLKLLKRILASPQRSLILIDELEIALHPTAQANLFFVINRLARRNNHTAIFSTHSATLVKLAKQSQLLWLRRLGCDHSIVVGPQKSVILGAIAGIEERATDRIFVVEDSSAKALVNGVLHQAAQEVEIEKRPKYRIIQVGSWQTALDLFRGLKAQNDSISRVSLLMDGEVHETILAERQSNPNNRHVQFYFSDPRQNFVLPYTPECLISLLTYQSSDGILHCLRDICNDFQIQLPQSAIPTTNGIDNRNACKTYFRAMVRMLTDAGIEEPEIKVFSAAAMVARTRERSIWSKLRKSIH